MIMMMMMKNDLMLFPTSVPIKKSTITHMHSECCAHAHPIHMKQTTCVFIYLLNEQINERTQRNAMSMIEHLFTRMSMENDRRQFHNHMCYQLKIIFTCVLKYNVRKRLVNIIFIGTY